MALETAAATATPPSGLMVVNAAPDTAAAQVPPGMTFEQVALLQTTWTELTGAGVKATEEVWCCACALHLGASLLRNNQFIDVRLAPCNCVSASCKGSAISQPARNWCSFQLSGRKGALLQMDANIYAFGEHVFKHLFAAHPELAALFPCKIRDQVEQVSVDDARVRRHIVAAFKALGDTIMGLDRPAETAAGLQKLIACASRILPTVLCGLDAEAWFQCSWDANARHKSVGKHL